MMQVAALDPPAHDDVRVVPERVGREEDALPGGAQRAQQGDEARVRMDELRRVGGDLALDRPVAVAEVDRAADVAVDLRVRLGRAAGPPF